MADYETVAKTERARLDASIPLNLRLSPDLITNLPKDVSGVPETCGLLTEEQTRITQMDGTALAQEIASGKITAVNAVTAVASRAAIAEQLVCCITSHSRCRSSLGFLSLVSIILGLGTRPTLCGFAGLEAHSPHQPCPSFLIYVDH